MGSLLTVIMQIIIGSFFLTKILSWYQKKDVDIMGAHIENAFDYEYKFDSDKGFFVAAALTNYDSNTTVTEEARYGELIIEHYGWGNDDSIS